MAGMEAAADTDDANNGHCLVEEDRLFVTSPVQGKQPDGAVKQGIFQTFRESFREKKSPFSSNSKGSKVRPSEDMAAPNNDSNMATLHVSPSPNLSARSPMISPLKNMGGLASIRRSLRLGSKKDKEKNVNKSDNQEQLLTVSEVTVEEAKEDVSVWEEIGESYTLPEIPLTPLSVMQINHLIDMEVLEEAYLNLLSMRQEFQQEQGSCGGEEAVSSVELAKKEKDLSLLYGALKDKIKTIVRDSNTLRSRNKELLVYVARVIQEEEKREGDPGGLAGPGSYWRESWREAVSEGVQAKLGSVPLDKREQNASWLAIHLGLLGKAILEDLEYVKKDLRWSYPRSFNVFSTYVRCYHKDVGQHLKKLQQQVTDLKDYYALLDWIINRYQSERIMGSLSLQPEMESESTGLSLEVGFLDQLKDRYCCRLQEDMKSALGKIIELENEDFWKERKRLRSNDNGDRPPDNEDNFLCSQFPMDIWTNVKSNLTNSSKIDQQLEMKVGYSCFEELKQFPKTFETEFRRCCIYGDVPPPLWTEYQIAYINSFITLKEYMENYRDRCPDQADNFNKEVDWLIGSLGQGLEDQYKNDVKIYQRRMMTRKWLTNDDDFQQLYKRTEMLSQNCALMRPPYVQTLVNTLHLHVVKEYLSQLMKNNYSCKNRKHERAAAKIRSQWAKLRELFEEMNSTHEWLHPVGDDLSDIIGERNKSDIKNNLQPLVNHYPDISKKHLAAVLYFRGLVGGRERQLILRKLTELKKIMGNNPDRSRALFSDMQVTANRDCLADIACLSFFLPDNDN